MQSAATRWSRWRARPESDAVAQRSRGSRCSRRHPRRGRAVRRDGRAARWRSTWPASTRCASMTPGRCCARTSRGRRRRSERRRGRACRAWCTPPRRRRSASRRGAVGTSRLPTAAGSCPTYERSKTEGERAALDGRRARPGVELVCVNPSSVQGPGRAGGTARFLLAFLDGRLKLFVHDHRQPGRHRRLRRGPPARCRARRARRALPAKRNDADDHRGARARGRGRRG